MHPQIKSLNQSEPRPTWSIMIPTYNCISYLEETLLSVLEQDMGPDEMQIAVVDDCSTDGDVEGLVKRVGQGRIDFFQQPQNMGHVQTFNSCIEYSRGNLLHILHGDDKVMPEFYSTMQHPFAANDQIGAAFCRILYVDENGHLTHKSRIEQEKSGIIDNWFLELSKGQRIQFPSIVVKRSVYEAIGGFNSRITRYGEDWEMWMRIAANFDVWYEPTPLAVYRIHPDSLSGSEDKIRKNAEEYRLVIELNRNLLPQDRKNELSWEARSSFAHALVRRARRKIERGDRRSGFILVHEAIKTHVSFSLILRIIYLLLDGFVLRPLFKKS